MSTDTEVASKLRQRARSFRSDADTLAALPVLQEPLASGLDPDGTWEHVAALDGGQP